MSMRALTYHFKAGPCPELVGGLPCSKGKGHLSAHVVSEATILAMIAERMDRLRETAAELRAGTINRVHAANRVERIANEVAKARAKETT